MGRISRLASYGCVGVVTVCMGLWSGTCAVPVPDWLRCNGTEQMSFFGQQRSSCEVRKIQEEVECWAQRGDWYLNDSVTIVDDMKLYKPCGGSYGNKNPCAWMLDGPMLKYYWHPQDNCSTPAAQYRPFDASHFCDLMRGQNVLIVGDSVSEAMASSWQNKLHSGLGIQECLSYPLPECDLTIHFIRNDYLSLVRERVDDPQTYQFPWVGQLEALNITTLVLNRGSHFVLDEQFLPAVNDTLHYLSGRSVSVVWRNTPHGHINMNSFAMAAPLKRSSEQLHMYKEDDRNWNYGHFKRQNSLVRELIRRHYPSVLYLDVFDPSVLRADSRYDPIHPCVPGFMDTWLELLYNAFSLIRPVPVLASTSTSTSTSTPTSIDSI